MFHISVFHMLSRRTENILCGGVPYFLWHGIRPSYKNIKIWGVRVYIINVRATRNKLDDRSHQGYLMGYAATTGVILCWKSDQQFLIHMVHHVWFDEYNYCLSILYITTRSPGFMLQIDFAFFNVESIRGFTSTFVAICSAT